ncbi:trypsin-like [Periplaneta americana]|uniref:trypsin-like n=1 Tax=Periplaneta americana TaxID=6978 RepID=UPI0037E917E3
MKFQIILLLATIVCSCLGAHIDLAKSDDVDSQIIGDIFTEDDLHGVIYVMKGKPGTPNTTQCVGTLINPVFVLTTATCISGGKPSDYSVIAEQPFYNNGLLHKVVEIILHDDFEDNALKYWPHDIGLLRLDVQVNIINTGISALPKRGHIRPNTGSVYGWGANCGFCGPSSYLKVLNDAFISNSDDCSSLFYDGKGPADSSICAGSLTGFYGVCDGDSGAPIVSKGTIYGVASWLNYPCGSVPAVFTNVQSHVEWIVRKMSATPLVPL